jgi:hypothetical protein
MNVTKSGSKSKGEHLDWFMSGSLSGHPIVCAEGRVEDKVRVRLINDRTGTRFHRYDADFKQVESGAIASIKVGMEKFNG